MLIYLQMISSDEDRIKFEEIYKKYKGLMFYTAMKIVSNTYDAEDVIDQAFVKIIKNLDKIHSIDSLETQAYIVIIVERKALDWIRVNQKYVYDGKEEYGIKIGPPEFNALAEALRNLRPRQREVLLLKYDQGYTTHEIAEIYGMTTMAVRKMITRAKDALAEELRRLGEEV